MAGGDKTGRRKAPRAGDRSPAWCCLLLSAAAAFPALAATPAHSTGYVFPGGEKPSAYHPLPETAPAAPAPRPREQALPRPATAKTVRPALRPAAHALAQVSNPGAAPGAARGAVRGAAPGAARVSSKTFRSRPAPLSHAVPELPQDFAERQSPPQSAPRLREVPVRPYGPAMLKRVEQPVTPRFQAAPPQFAPAQFAPPQFAPSRFAGSQPAGPQYQRAAPYQARPYQPWDTGQFARPAPVQYQQRAFLGQQAGPRYPEQPNAYPPRGNYGSAGPAPGREGVASGDHLPQWLRQHQNQSPMEQERALRQEPGFSRLAPQQQQNLVDTLHRLNAMPAERRQRTLGRIENWERLSPQMREAVRNSGQQMNDLRPDRKRLVQKAFRDLREMPPPQRQGLLRSPQFAMQFSAQERSIMANLLAVEPYQRPMAPPY